MPKVMTKKALQGRKGAHAKTLHPKSRRAKQITRVSHRDDKLGNAQRARRKTENSRSDRLMFFANEYDLSLGCTTLERLHELALRFIARWDDEIEAEAKERRAGRAKTNHHIKLEQSRATAEKEYREGFLLPDLTSEVGVAQLRHFNDQLDGDSSFIPRLRLVRIFRDDPKTMVVEQPGAPTATGQVDGAEADEMDEDEDDVEEDED